MEYKDIINDIKNKKLKKTYLFYGKETYLLDNIVKVSKEILNPSLLDFNYSILDGRDITLDIILNSIETLPFMDDNRIVIVKDFELLRGKRKNFSEEQEEIIIKHFKNIPDTTCLIFIVYGEIDKRRKIVKTLEKEGIGFNCDKLRGNELFKWVKSKFQKEKVHIDQSVIMYFLNNEDYENKNSNKTLSDLENEIIKITSFIGRGNTVTKESIDNLSSKKIENDVFKLIDAIGSKNGSSAIRILNDMILEGESPLMILSMIGRQFRIIIQAKEFQKIGYSSNVIAQKIGIHPYIVGKALSQGVNFKEEIILNSLNELVNIDYSIKNGLMNDMIALEVFISKVCA